MSFCWGPDEYPSSFCSGGEEGQRGFLELPLGAEAAGHSGTLMVILEGNGPAQ